MSNLSRLLLLSLLVVSVAGCIVNPTRKEMKSADANKIRSTRAISIIAQDEITAHVVNPNISGAAGGGLLVALLDASIIESRTKEAEGFIGPLRHGLDGLDFRSEFWARQKELFDGPNWMQSKQPENTALDMTVSQIRDTVKTMSEDAFLIIRTNYHLSADFTRMVVEAYAQLWSRGQDLPTYAAKIEYQSPAVTAGDKADAIDFWNKNRAQAARATLYEGMDEVIKMLKIDLFQNKGVTVAATGEHISLPYAYPSQTFLKSVGGDVLSKSNGRYIIKASDGRLLSLAQNNEFKIPENKTSRLVTTAAVPEFNTPVATPIKALPVRQKLIQYSPSLPIKPIVLVSWAEPGQLKLYGAMSIDSYSRQLLTVMTRVTRKYYPEDVEIIKIGGSPAKHIADNVSQVAPSKSLCSSNNASYVITALAETSTVDHSGPSSHSREIEYHFHNCADSSHLNIKQWIDRTVGDRFVFEQGFTQSFNNFMTRSIAASRNVTLKDPD